MKKKKVLLFVIVFSLLLSSVMVNFFSHNLEAETLDLWDGSVATSFSSGTGSSDDPYVISTGSELAYLASQVNNQVNYANTYFILNNDIDLYGNSIEEGMTITREAEFVGNIPHRGDKIVPDTNKEYTSKVIYKGEYYRLKYPREGYEAKAYKNYYKDGKLIKREEIRHEKYQPIDGIVIEGVEDLPEGFTLPQSDVEIIKPQTVSSSSSKTIAKKIKSQNPTRYAL